MRLEPLGNGVEVYVTDAHHFSTDTILLAHFAAPKNGDRIVELGTGCGTIPLLLIRDTAPREITRARGAHSPCFGRYQGDPCAHARGRDRSGYLQPAV